MKRPIFSLLLAAALMASLATSAPAAQTSTWAADPVHSFANFTAIHLGFAKVNGVIPIVSASLEIPGGTTLPTHVEATLDPKGINTGTAMRDNDLRSPHFLDTAQFPAMSFVSTGFAAVDATHFTMTGNLTMHGQTHPITLNVEVIGQGTGMHDSQHIGYEGKATIDRTQWGMNLMYPVVSNTIDLTIDVDAVKK